MTRYYPLMLLAVTLAVTACTPPEGDRSRQGEASSPVETERHPEPDTSVAAEKLQAISDEYVGYVVNTNPYLKLISGERVTALPDQTLNTARRRVAVLRDLLERLRNVDRNALPYNDSLTHDILRRELTMAIEGLDHFWLGFNVTPYQAGYTFSTLLPVALGNAALEDAGDVAAYLALVEDVGRFVNDQQQRLEQQAQRGIRLPKPALPGVRNVFHGLRRDLPQLVAVAPDRMTALDDTLRRELTDRIPSLLESRLFPAIDKLLGYLGADYEEQAPESVGLGQYPGGAAAYAFAIRRETTLDLDPEAIHQHGLDYLEKIQDEMAAIRNELGFEGTAAAFHQQMGADPQFLARTPRQVEQRYQSYIDRIEPHILDYFSTLPEAPYGVRRLDPAAEAGMTFGYYQAPSPGNPMGLYRYNGSNLESRPMVWTGALIYHELIPGHHFHIASQRENEDLSEFRKLTGLIYAAFTEGWANYAASLSLEMGIMDDPYDRYGWLLFNSFISSRLVLDTGMNHFGWSLQQARQFMLDNTFSSEEEVNTETLRYSTDLPAQALAYKLGYEKFRAIREAAETRMGQEFDIREFHTAILDYGAMPLPGLEQHVKTVLNK
ncbi:DUF885 domain-containing protein [Kineobactrum salinum]|uniref:DUF885 domain-containing protein n=1 Tax=Kineobactrum salinum TaxID=2708301 RepID=A0A6C0UAR2_9GAMM|nr:DUF885 domain-containing protein [Kineobactrum salinum]QIB66984.1 DUF885 domain-containing protein [Kineobactrum salinum]